MAGLDPAICSTLRIHQFMNHLMGGWVYMVTNKRDGTLHIGVTGDLARRAWEHPEGILDGFTRKYRLKQLVWAEFHNEVLSAIQREKSIKHWPRAWKVELIQAQNPDWNDLYDQLI
jgi:putative endonuclease